MAYVDVYSIVTGEYLRASYDSEDSQKYPLVSFLIGKIGLTAPDSKVLKNKKALLGAKIFLEGKLGKFFSREIVKNFREEIQEFFNTTVNSFLKSGLLTVDENGDFALKYKGYIIHIDSNEKLSYYLYMAGVPLENLIPLMVLESDDKKILEEFKKEVFSFTFGPATSFKIPLKDYKDFLASVPSKAEEVEGLKVLLKDYLKRFIEGKEGDLDRALWESYLYHKTEKVLFPQLGIELASKLGKFTDSKDYDTLMPKIPDRKEEDEDNKVYFKAKRIALAIMYVESRGEKEENKLLDAYRIVNTLISSIGLSKSSHIDFLIRDKEALFNSDGNVDIGIFSVTGKSSYPLYSSKIKRKTPKIRGIL